MAVVYAEVSLEYVGCMVLYRFSEVTRPIDGYRTLSMVENESSSKPQLKYNYLKLFLCLLASSLI